MRIYKGIAAFLIVAAAVAALAASPARALTPANTVISISSLQISAASGSVTLTKPPSTPSLTVKAVSGLAWQVTPVGASVLSGQTTTYQYRFVHNGNIGIAPAQDNFYITVASAWLQSVCQDAACTVPATSTISLPPNAGNTYTFYVKVAVPANSDGQTSTTTVTIDNEYYHVNSANDPFGDPDRISHAVATFAPDITAPALAITSPAAGANLVMSSATVAGTTEVGATGYISVSPAGATATLTVSPAGIFSQTMSMSQGQNVITVQAADAWGNTSIATRAVFVDSIAPVANITSPVSGAALSGSVVVTGSAYDMNFKEYSLKYGPGTSPTAWGVITATSTTQVSASSLGTWNVSSLYGDYVILLTSLDNYGNATEFRIPVSVGSASSVSATIPAGSWSMVSIPGAPYNPDPSSFLGSGRYEIQRWDPRLASPDPYLYQYVKTFSVAAGTGFWIKPYGTPISYNVNAWITNTTQKYSIPIYAGWNQIGDPFTRDMLWDYFSVKNSQTGTELSLASAIQQNWIDGSFYSYDNNAYAAHGAGENLVPNKGYFVKSFVNGELIIDPAAGKSGGVAKIIRPQYEMKLQLAASGGAFKDTDNFAGVLKGSSDELDPGDSGEPPLVEPYLTLYFPHEDWTGAAAGRYSKDVRPEPVLTSPEASPVKTWTFTVKSSEPGTPVTVSWPNAADLPDNYEVSVTDISTGEDIDVRRRLEYTYTPSDSVGRVFRLTARKTGLLPEIELPVSLSAGWNMISVPLEPELTDANTQLGDDLTDPMIYQFHENRLFDRQSADRVDIQAGIGYWLYSDAQRQVDFKGVPTSDAKPVDVPLALGWNLVGNPYSSPLLIGDNIKVTKDGETLTFADAASRGWIEGRLFHFNNQTDGYDAIGAGAELSPFNGYIIKANEKCTLRFAR